RLDATEDTVFKPHVVDRHAGETDYPHHSRAGDAVHAREQYITQHRFLGSSSAGVVKKIDSEHGFGNSSYEDVAHEDVFDHATTPGVRFEAQRPIEIG